MTNARWQQSRRVRAAATPNGPGLGGTSFGNEGIGTTLPSATLFHRNDSVNEIHAVFFQMQHVSGVAHTLTVNFGPEASPFSWPDSQPANSSLGDRYFFLKPGDILSVHSIDGSFWRFNLAVLKFKMA